MSWLQEHSTQSFHSPVPCRMFFPVTPEWNPQQGSSVLLKSLEISLWTCFVCFAGQAQQLSLSMYVCQLDGSSEIFCWEPDYNHMFLAKYLLAHFFWWSQLIYPCLPPGHEECYLWVTNCQSLLWFLLFLLPWEPIPFIFLAYNCDAS